MGNYFLGIDVVECVGRLVLVDLAAGNLPCDDLAEQAIIGLAHTHSLPNGSLYMLYTVSSHTIEPFG